MGADAKRAGMADAVVDFELEYAARLKALGAPKSKHGPEDLDLYDPTCKVQANEKRQRQRLAANRKRQRARLAKIAWEARRGV